VRPGDRRDRVRSQYEYVVYEPVIQERAPAPSSVLSTQFGRLPGANDKRLLNSFLNVKDKFPVA
jgi:hypothetical protein